MGVLIVVRITGFRALKKIEQEGGTGTQGFSSCRTFVFGMFDSLCVSLRISKVFLRHCNFVARRWEDSHPAHGLPRSGV